MGYIAESSRRVARQHQISDVVQEKTRLSKVNGSKEEELVKHMSNLPKYLQRAEMERTVQAKALNFGVIDWNHLEKWKYSDRMPARGVSFPTDGRPPKARGSSPQQKHARPPFPSLSHEQKVSEPVKHSRVKSMPGQLAVPISTLDVPHKNLPSKPIASRRSYSETNIDKDKKVSDHKTKSGKDNLFSDQFKNDRSMNCAPVPQNIVILIPRAKHSPKRNCSGTSQISESRTISHGDSAEPEKKRYVEHCSSQESCSREHYPIPYSCPLPSIESGMDDVNSDLVTCQHKQSTVDSAEASPVDLDIVEQQAVKGRYPSPTRRFSLNLGMMSRSLSFKETSAGSRLRDTHTIHKSGPVSSGVCDSHVAGDNREKSNASGKGRSSPLRRLLDPLLRSKGIHSAETSKPHNENFKPTNRNGHPCEKKHQASTLGALLQLSIKDGLPFFKLVVDSSNDILVAAVKQLPKPEKVDGCLVYSIYTVSEIKKKNGGWIGQGSSKGKCSEFGYNMIGMMKVSTSSVFKSDFQDCKDESVVRESILYSVNQASAFLPDREIAAIHVQDKIMKHNDGQTSDKQNITVILPGGVHGMPQKGAPSSLIERWKSGGLCDCGGWDVGCKLQVLTEQEKNCSNLDRVTLFLQGGAHERKLIFCLAPLRNGLYSVQFDQSVPLLEAFSICVAILTSQKVCSMLEAPDPSAVRETDTTKATTGVVQGQGSAKYVPSPPPSPVARI